MTGLMLMGATYLMFAVRNYFVFDLPMCLAGRESSLHPCMPTLSTPLVSCRRGGMWGAPHGQRSRERWLSRLHRSNIRLNMCAQGLDARPIAPLASLGAPAASSAMHPKGYAWELCWGVLCGTSIVGLALGLPKEREGRPNVRPPTLSQSSDVDRISLFRLRCWG